MAKVNENEEVMTDAEELAKEIREAEDAIVIGKGSLKSNKGKRLIDKGQNYEITFND